MLPYIISQDIVKYLHKIDGFSVEEIADITSMSIKNVDNTLNGLYTFTQHNIKSLVTNYNKTIIEILAKACPESHLPKKLKKNVTLYKHVKKIKKGKKYN